MNKKVKVICSRKTGVEGEAINQLEFASKLEGMISAYGMPDIHPGKGYPIGASFLSKDIIYPYLIGNDIGCGMSFFQLDINRLKQDRTIKKIKNLDIFDDSYLSWFNKFNLENKFEYSFGTVGGGNHFAEFQQVEKVINQEVFDEYNLNKKSFFLLVHSGSRGLGELILNDHIRKFNSKGLHIKNEELSFKEYMKKHNEAIQWAKLNRLVIADKLSKQLNFKYDLLNDIEHNFIEEVNGLFLHRKGAIPSNKGLVVIPGSRGHNSYLVKPKNKKIENSLFSLSHGAGRKWKRSEVKKRLSHKYKVNDLQKTKMGSRVICEDKDLLYEESPLAYKNISNVIQDLIDYDLIKVIAILKPYITYKKKRRCSCD